MTYIDIIIICIVALGGLIGLWRGVGKSAINLVCFILSLMICYFVADYCLRFVLNVDVIKSIVMGENVSIRRLIQEFISENPDGVVELLYEPLIARYESMGGTAAWGATEHEFLSIAISLHVFTVIMCLLLYLAARIVTSIIGYILKIIFVHGIKKVLSRVLGAILGVAKGFAAMCVTLYLMSAILPFGIGAPIAKAMDDSALAPPLCKIIYPIAAENLFSDETLKLALSGAGFEYHAPEQAAQ